MNSRRQESYSDQLHRLFDWKYPGKETIEATEQVTEACTLCCTYCYQHDKTPARMNFYTGAKFIDRLFEAYKDTHFAVIIEFIGGEPLMEPELIEQLADYWRYQCVMHMDEVPWYKFIRFSLCSNGTEWYNPKVQHMLKHIGHLTSMTITIDGNKELHDMCRLHPDGRGSYDEAKAAADDIEQNYGLELGSKITIAPANLPFLGVAIKHYFSHGSQYINANCVYEDVWSVKDAKLFYEELKKIADYKLENYPEVYLSLFEESSFKPMSPNELQQYCGGNGKMICCAPDGRLYPCLRYTPTSVGKKDEYLVVGTVETGIDLDAINELQKVNRRNSSDDECFYCPIGSGCGVCQALVWETYGTLYARTKFHCIMHKARALANVYYWNKYYRSIGSNERFENYIPEEWALEIIDKEEWEMLNKLASE